MAKITMSKEQYQNVTKAERQLTDVLPDLDKLEDCGVDCSAAKEHVKQELARASKLKQHFAPNMLTD